MNANQKKSPAWAPVITGFILLGLLAISVPILAEQVTHTYDNLNRLTRTDFGNGRAIEYTYDAAGNRLSQVVTVPNQSHVLTTNVERERSVPVTALPSGTPAR